MVVLRLASHDPDAELGHGRSARSARMAAMRVYLGSDHAGFELKNEIIEHLKKNGHEPIDCGAYTYDAEDDYPAFCIAAALKTVGDGDSLGIVIGGSGNGEQIAANKVPGVALRVGVEHRDGQAGPRTQQRPADGHRRPHAHPAGGFGDRRRLPGCRVVESRTAPTSYRHLEEVRTDARPTRRARRAGLISDCPKATRFTGWHGSTSASSGEHPSSSPARRAASPTGPPPSTAGC